MFGVYILFTTTNDVICLSYPIRSYRQPVYGLLVFGLNTQTH